VAKFEKGDWVQIIPSPDTRSDLWTVEHNKFCGKVGQIIDTNEEDGYVSLYRVSVHFNYKQASLYGSYSVWFEDKHVIKSSKWEADRASALNKEYEEYMRTESNIKKRRDDLLRNIFCEPEEKKDEEMDYDPSEDGWVFGNDWYMKGVDFD
jgi:hypothetical protein